MICTFSHFHAASLFHQRRCSTCLVELVAVSPSTLSSRSGPTIRASIVRCWWNSHISWKRSHLDYWEIAWQQRIHRCSNWENRWHNFNCKQFIGTTCILSQVLLRVAFCTNHLIHCQSVYGFLFLLQPKVDHLFIVFLCKIGPKAHYTRIIEGMFAPAGDIQFALLIKEQVYTSKTHSPHTDVRRFSALASHNAVLLAHLLVVPSKRKCCL